jgi:hypothetical protein
MNRYDILKGIIFKPKKKQVNAPVPVKNIQKLEYEIRFSTFGCDWYVSVRGDGGSWSNCESGGTTIYFKDREKAEKWCKKIGLINSNLGE